MLRTARDLSAQFPGSVSFLDFDQDFDKPVEVTPVVPDRVFWEKSLAIALADLAALVAPSRIVLCEGADKVGAPGDGQDARIYDRIFEPEMPETRFISLGSATDLQGDRVLVVQALAGLIPGLKILKVIDRDDRSNAEIEELQRKRLRVLSERQLESYLYGDEVLTKLCLTEGKPERIDELLQAKADAMNNLVARGKPLDDAKSAAGEIYNACKKILQLTAVGNNSKSFMRDTLAPLVTPDTQTYKRLFHDIFGEAADQ
jgi:hypothetical protein